MPLKPNELAEQNSKFRIGDVLLADLMAVCSIRSLVKLNESMNILF